MLKMEVVTIHHVLITTHIMDVRLCSFNCKGFNPIRSGEGGFKSPPPLRFFALTHLILELHYCTLVTFPKK